MPSKTYGFRLACSSSALRFQGVMSRARTMMIAPRIRGARGLAG